MPLELSVEKQVWQWLDSIVIDLNLCPFAKKPRTNNQIKVTVCGARKDKAVLNQFQQELRFLTDTDPNLTDTTLFVVPDHLYDFYDYLDFLDKAQQLLISMHLEGVLQLASFHPDYVFDGVEEDSRENYTNRAPFPIIHILREATLTRLVEKYPNPEQIPENNIDTLNRLTEPQFQNLFQDKT